MIITSTTIVEVKVYYYCYRPMNYSINLHNLDQMKLNDPRHNMIPLGS